MANQRILQGAAATLTFHNYDADGVAVDAVGAVTVVVTRADGTTIAGLPATIHGVTGIYTVALTGVHTAALDLLTATWTEAAVASHTTQHEIVGGYLFSLAEVRAFTTLQDTVKYPNAAVIVARAEVEDELEQMRNAAFVPRYARLILDGSGDREIVTGLSWLRSLRTAKTLSVTGSSTSTAFTATQIGACVITDDGRIRRGDGDIFIYGAGNIVVEVEHGFTAWGQDLKQAALTRLRERLNQPLSGIPDRATTYTSVDGDSYRLGAEGPLSTGNPWVDSVYERYPTVNQGSQPASRLLTFDPQYGGVFRGWPNRP